MKIKLGKSVEPNVIYDVLHSAQDYTNKVSTTYISLYSIHKTILSSVWIAVYETMIGIKIALNLKLQNDTNKH